MARLAALLRRLPIILGDWRWLPFYLQRQVRGATSRRRVASVVARLRPPVVAPSVNGAMSAMLKQDGVVRLGALLDGRQCSDVVEQLRAAPVTDIYRPNTPPFLPLDGGRHPNSHVAYHRPVDIAKAPHLLALANRPDLLALAGDFLGCRPTISYLAAWWSYATDLGAQQAELFHRDVDDWRFLKLFVYLTDVSLENGPHVYVRRSADDPRLTTIRRYSDGEVASAFPADDVLTLTGKAGDGFIENTTGLHRGRPVENGIRLMFQAVYGLSPLPYAPKRPLLRRDDVAGGNGFDPWVNRLYLHE